MKRFLNLLVNSILRYSNKHWKNYLHRSILSLAAPELVVWLIVAFNI